MDQECGIWSPLLGAFELSGRGGRVILQAATNSYYVLTYHMIFKIVILMLRLEYWLYRLYIYYIYYKVGICPNEYFHCNFM